MLDPTTTLIAGVIAVLAVALVMRWPRPVIADEAGLEDESFK